MSERRESGIFATRSELFGVDLRALAAFRIGIAGILLVDLLTRGWDAAAFFTDAGVMPRMTRIELFGEFKSEHLWSLHLLSGVYWVQLLMILIAVWFALWLLAGYRTRLAAVASWLLILSLDHRNSLILNSGDVLLRCMLFWSLFLPLGARASIDACLRKPRIVGPRVCSVASTALLLQLAMMYVFSAMFKFNPIWTTDLSGLYFALNCDSFTTSLGLWFRQFPTAMRAGTFITFWLEAVGPLVAFVPIATARLRVGVVAAFVMLHLGIGVMMTVGLFWPICIVCWLVYLPSAFWDRLAGWLHPTRLARRWQRAMIAMQRWPIWRRPETSHMLRRWYVEVLLAALLVYTLAWNVREVLYEEWKSWPLPQEANFVGQTLGLDQNWAMFAPKPRTLDGWYVMRGTLIDEDQGEVSNNTEEDNEEVAKRYVNLWDPGKDLPWEKPANVSRTYRRWRWRRYLDNLSSGRELSGMHRMRFCQWLAEQWNAREAKDDPQRRVAVVELIFRVEITPEPGEPLGELEQKTLFTYRPIYYGDN